jgi:hypothetical protein
MSDTPTAETLERERVVTLDKDFDGNVFAKLRPSLSEATAAAPLLLDFRDVRHCHPFALARLFELLGDLGGSVRVRGLCQHHYQLLGYLGFNAS